MDLLHIQKYSRPGIFVLVNDFDKMYQIYHSVNMVSKVCLLVQEFQTNTHSDRVLNTHFNLCRIYVDVLDFGSNKKELIEYWSRQYLEQSGYQPYRDVSSRPFKVSYNYLMDYGKARVQVVVVWGGKRVVVGVFHRKSLAINFIETYYKNNKINIVYAKNRLTRKYLKDAASR